MRDEPYEEQLKVGYTPGFDDPGERRKYFKTALARLKELRREAPFSDDESMDLRGDLNSSQTHGQRRMRSARSAPAMAERKHFPVSGRGEIDCNGGTVTKKSLS